MSVAKTAIWIAEAQMFKETEAIIHKEMDFLPLHTNANIHEGNALQMDWNDVIPASELSYIMGNPPFVGARLMSKKQKEELFSLFEETKKAGNLDYVCCWYIKSAQYIESSNIKCAFVSTNSISQGEQVPILWGALKSYNINIIFAYRSFLWDSEAKTKAHVYCVIVGFSSAVIRGQRRLYSSNQVQLVDAINPYLVAAKNIFITSRKKPLSPVPSMVFGNMPNDGGQFLLSEDECKDIMAVSPKIERYIHPFLGAHEFINNKKKYCIWLVGASPSDIRDIKELRGRIEYVRRIRSESSRAGTRKLADTPTLFGEIRQPDTSYLLVPRVSSENRRYVPIGFFTPDFIAGDTNLIVPNAEIYHFGILTSNVHMAWMRTVCGRLKSDYRYSKDIVYNNFPWPTPTAKQKERIEKTAQGILDARALYPNESLAALYDPTLMPKELRYAHRANDKAVMDAYGFSTAMTEEDCVAELLKRYEALVHNEQ